MLNPLDLSGKLILVTGASSGIGRGIALVLAELGARLILTGRRDAALHETAALTKAPDYHLCRPFDLASLSEIDNWLKHTVEAAGSPLNGLVHAAGVSERIPLRAISARNIESAMALNVHAALLLVRAASAKGNHADRDFSMVVISSVAATVASPGLIVYSASKAALDAGIRSAAKELAPKKIRLNCISPGYVRTPMLDEAERVLPEFSRIREQQFLGFVEPEEVGQMAAFLLSGCARKITGAKFLIDGGFSL